jgi:hypothetical protein
MPPFDPDNPEQTPAIGPEEVRRMAQASRGRRRPDPMSLLPPPRPLPVADDTVAQPVPPARVSTPGLDAAWDSGSSGWSTGGDPWSASTPAFRARASNPVGGLSDYYGQGTSSGPAKSFTGFMTTLRNRGGGSLSSYDQDSK